MNRLVVMSLACIAAGCGFDASGSGMGGGASVGATTGETDGTDTSASPSTTRSHEASGTADGDDGPDVEAPDVAIWPGAEHDFGFVLLGLQETHGLTVTNTGSVGVTFVGVDLEEPFSWAGTCAVGLAPEQSCTIEVTFEPTVPRAEKSTLVLTVEDPQGQTGTATYELVGAGYSDNLVINGDGASAAPGASSPPHDWIPADDVASWTNDCARADGPYSGETCLGPASMNGNHPMGSETEIHQTIELRDAWHAAVDANEIQLELCGQARIMALRGDGSPDDRWRLAMELRDDDDASISTPYDSGYQPPCDPCRDEPKWEAIAELHTVASGTRSLRLRLGCEAVRSNIGICDAFFDDLSVRALPVGWPAPPCDR